ncbi:general transcription factor II-I repeat domain-containing protein 2-like isoform X1 [Loxodonta africana]|uniref:general transcription factor II-I repeat domain-containing protein 2-like isoform X1 n=1 Tax=Loxodonta africana TaxID=9785 RepID=UPI0030CF8C28
MSLSPKEIEDGEDGIAEDKDSGSRDKIVTPQKNGRKVISPSRKGARWSKCAKERCAQLEREIRRESHKDDEDQSSESDQNEKDAETEALSPTRTERREALPVWAEEEEPDSRGAKNEQGPEEEAEEEEPIRKTPDKWKKEMANQKASPETKKLKLEDRDARTLVIKNLPDKVTQHELKEVFEDAFQVRLVNKAGMSERIAHIEFKSQAAAERAWEEKQGMAIHGLAVALDHAGEKRQGQENGDGKNSLRRVGKRKMEQESHVFQEKWERAYFFVEVKNILTCLICRQSLSVSKEYNLRLHYETNHSKNHNGYTEKMRNRKFNELKKRLKLQHDLVLNLNKISDAAMKCSYVLSEKMAQASKPLTDGEFIKECLLSAAEIMCPEQRQAFANIRLTGNTVAQQVDYMSENLQDKLPDKVRSLVAFSIAAHESTDENNGTQLAVFIRGVDETFDVTEELLDMVPMTGTTSGNDIVLCVEKSLKKFNVDWSKLVSVTTDGDSAMAGIKQLVTKLKSKVSGLCKDTELKSVRGLILQESLYTKKLKMGHVMDIVIYTITWLRSHGSNHGKFNALFSELDAQYGSLFYHMDVRWLSRGIVLKQFFELLEEIDFFLSSKGKSVPQLTSKDWIKDLAFLVDITAHLNTLAISLQGRCQVVTQMYDSVRSFLAKLCLWETNLAKNNLAHFPTLKLVSGNKSDGLNYIPKVRELKSEFQKTYSDFKLYENELILFSSPFSININDVIEELQMEVIELQHNTILKTKYDDVGIPEFYRYLGNGYPKYKNHCAKILSMFGSTYVCEQLFSAMKLNKTRSCSLLKDTRM